MGSIPPLTMLGYLYDPVANSWSAFPNMVDATRNYGYTELNGFLYAIGRVRLLAGHAKWSELQPAVRREWATHCHSHRHSTHRHPHIHTAPCQQHSNSHPHSSVARAATITSRCQQVLR